MNRDEAIAAARTAETGHDLWEIMLAYCEGWGFGRVAYQHFGHDEKWGSSMPHNTQIAKDQFAEDVLIDVSPDLHIIAHGIPREMIENYVANRLYEIDPIPELARRSATPFMFEDAQKLVQLTEEQARFLASRKAHGMGQGVAIQVFGPNGRNGYNGLSNAGETRSFSSDELAEMQIVAQLLHIRLCEFIEARNPPLPALSEREQEVLSWMARGKSKSVIAEILGLSVHTIDTVVRRIFRKLGVGDRTAAILKAMNAGMIPLVSSAVT